MERSQFVKNWVKQNLQVILIYFFLLTGAIWHFVPVFKPAVVGITWLALLLIGIVVFTAEFKAQTELSSKQKLIGWVVFGFILTLTLEIVGVQSGLIFGPYVYGDVLGLKILGAPIIIGLNWVVVVWGSIKLTEKVRASWVRPLLAATMAVLFDVILEPVAIKLGYWQWLTPVGSVPFQNYLAWFGIALILIAVAEFLQIKPNTNLVKHAFFAQMIFLFALWFV